MTKEVQSTMSEPPPQLGDPIAAAVDLEAWVRAGLPPDVGLSLCPSPELAGSQGSGDRLDGVAKRKREFFLGRQCAVQALHEVGLRAGSDSEATTTAGPIGESLVGVRADRSPVWPPGYVGSISHSRRWVTAVAANIQHYRGLGIDTEVVIPADLRETVRQEVGTPVEWALLRSTVPDDLAVTLLFSAKESFFKLWYPLIQQFLSFQDVRLVAATLEAVTFPGSDRRDQNLAAQSHLRLTLTSNIKISRCPSGLTSPILARWRGEDVITFGCLPGEYVA